MIYCKLLVRSHFQQLLFNNLLVVGIATGTGTLGLSLGPRLGRHIKQKVTPTKLADQESYTKTIVPRSSIYETSQQTKKQTAFGTVSVKFLNILSIRGRILSEERRESMSLYDFDKDKCVCSQKHQTRHPQL